MYPVWERRKSQRMPVQIWVEEKAGDATYFHRTADLSVGGLFLDGTLPQQPGTRVRLRISLPGDEKPVEVAGEILPPAPGQEVGMPVRFVELPEAERKRIESFIAGVIGLPVGRESE